MPLYDYHCPHCGKKYEEIRPFESREGGDCRHCGKGPVELKIVRFRVGGRGDLRETTEFHGCHPALDPHDTSTDPGGGHVPPSPRRGTALAGFFAKGPHG